MKWFRLYTEVLHDAKVQRLHPALFKSWINLLCVANRDRNRGTLPPIEEIAFALRVKPIEAQRILEQLESKGLLDRDEPGAFFPHNWSQRQRCADDGATRQQRYREKKNHKNNQLPKKVTSLSRDGDALDTDTDKKNKPLSLDSLRLSGVLADLILMNNPRNAKLTSGKRDTTVRRWAVDVDKLLQIDGQDPATVEQVVRWAQADGFWRTNILSGAALRRQWDRLVLRVAATEKRNGDEPNLLYDEETIAFCSRT